ncbi:MAG TPA: lysophospholipid acyltransferase family protein, partial [Ignavibacteriaceae bacterium]
YYIIPIRKDVVLDNLKHAFPDLSPKEIKDIAYGSYRSFAITLIEILYLPRINKDPIKNLVKINNLELVEKKEKEKNGLLLLTAHFGNWEYFAISTGLKLNKNLSVIVKSQRNPYVNNWMNKARTRLVNEVVPLGISIRNVYAALLRKGIIGLVADQRGPEESIKLNFFGRKTSVYTGPAILSLKMNSPIIYGVAIRQPDYSYKVDFVEVSKEGLPDDYDGKVKVLSERLLKLLEESIREHPEQWLWMHKRWKH